MENQIPDIEITDSELSDTDSELSDTEIVSEIPKTIEEMVSSVLYYCTNSAFTSRFILDCNCCNQTGSDGQYIMVGRKHPMCRVYYHSNNYQCVRAIYIAQLKIFMEDNIIGYTYDSNIKEIPIKIFRSSGKITDGFIINENFMDGGDYFTLSKNHNDAIGVKVNFNDGNNLYDKLHPLKPLTKIRSNGKKIHSKGLIEINSKFFETFIPKIKLIFMDVPESMIEEYNQWFWKVKNILINTFGKDGFEIIAIGENPELLRKHKAAMKIQKWWKKEVMGPYGSRWNPEYTFCQKKIEKEYEMYQECCKSLQNRD
tara:strand:- start:171 stop:1109 length:939 start_codon:yes stop_codon:yes gene_type:complete